VLGDPERVEPESFSLAGTLLHTGGLVDAEIRPRERRKVDAESHGRRSLPSACPLTFSF
jgi:hypothetical protein